MGMFGISNEDIQKMKNIMQQCEDKCCQYETNVGKTQVMLKCKKSSKKFSEALQSYVNAKRVS